MNEYIKKLLTLKDHEVASLYKTVFDTKEGRLVLEDLMTRCYARTSTAVDVASGLYVTNDVMNRNEGMRMVILHIDTQLNFEPEEESRGVQYEN